jgi:hypothetical protein
VEHKIHLVAEVEWKAGAFPAQKAENIGP